MSNFDGPRSLGRKVKLFNPLEFEAESDFDQKNHQNKVTLNQSFKTIPVRQWFDSWSRSSIDLAQRL